MKIGYFVACVALTVQGFETSGDGTTTPESDTTTNTETSSVASVTTIPALCVGKCDSLPNTECVIVQSNSNGYACPCIAGFELDTTGQCTEIINDTTEDNISTVSTATVDLSGASTSSGVNVGTLTPETSENPKIIPGVTVPMKPYENLEEKSTSGTILSSVAGILIAAIFF